MVTTTTTGKISFLKRDPLYIQEKPYLVLLPPSQDAEIDRSIPRSNLLYEYNLVEIGDVRGHAEKYQIEECGFQYFQHKTAVNSLPGLHGDGPTREDVDTYKVETEVVLKDFFQAAHVVCYDLRVRPSLPLMKWNLDCKDTDIDNLYQIRENVSYERDEIDLRDPLLREGPAVGAHTGM